MRVCDTCLPLLESLPISPSTCVCMCVCVCGRLMDDVDTVTKTNLIRASETIKSSCTQYEGGRVTGTVPRMVKLRTVRMFKVAPRALSLAVRTVSMYRCRARVSPSQVAVRVLIHVFRTHT